MKRWFCVILSVVILSVITVNSFAFKIDGVQKRTEWENSSTILLLDREESNNKTDFGFVNWSIEDGSLFLCFCFNEKTAPENSSMTGVSLVIENSEEFTITAKTSPAESDSDEYHFEGFSTYDNIGGGVCEIRVGAKYGLPSEISGRARFIDSDGSYSNVYDFVISNNTYTYFEPDYNTEESPNTTTLKPKTTNPTTEKSTKAEKTTKKSTSKTTRKSGSGLLGLIFDSKEETTVKPTKVLTTKSSSEKTKKSSSKTNKSTKSKTNITNSNSAVQTSIVYITDTNNISELNNSVSTAESTKYKLITAIFGGITLVTVAALGTIGANKKAEKKKQKDKSDN